MNNYFNIGIEIIGVDDAVLNAVITAPTWSDDQKIILDIKLNSKRDDMGRAVMVARCKHTPNSFGYARYIHVIDDDLMLAAQIVTTAQDLLCGLVHGYVHHNNDSRWGTDHYNPNYEAMLYNIINSVWLPVFAVNVVKKIRENESK